MTPRPSPPLVALAGWLLPGAGYWLIGERARALTVGFTIIALFLLGILLGGVRAIQVPGYGENGVRLLAWSEVRSKPGGGVEPTGAVKIAEEQPQGQYQQGTWVATDLRSLLRDIGNKPWSICQVLTGPIGLAGGAWSVSASRGDEPAGVLSHSRINEIAVLYTAVAGMLNLMVMIDAAARAGRQPSPVSGHAAPSRTAFNSRPEAA